MKNIKDDVVALKSLMKEIEKDLKEQLKVEDVVPEDKTDSLHKLLEFTKDEMKKRPSTSKPGKVEKGKKSSKKDVKKSIQELKSLIEEISVFKAAAPEPIGAQSADARLQDGVAAAEEGGQTADNPPAPTPDTTAEPLPPENVKPLPAENTETPTTETEPA